MTHSRNPEAVVIEAKADVERVMAVDTPWGRMAIEEGMNIRRDWGYHTADGSCRTPFGTAAVSLHVDGLDGDPHPRLARIVFIGGGECWGEPKGEPVERDGVAVAWVAHVYLDPLTGMPTGDKAPSVSLSKFDAPQSERLVMGIAPSVTNLALELDIVSGIVGLLREWAAESDYVRAFYGAVARILQDTYEGEVERTRLAYLRATALRDEAHTLALGAEYGRKELRSAPDDVSPHMALVKGVREGEGEGGRMTEVRHIDLRAPSRVTIEFEEDTLSMRAVLHDGRHVLVEAIAAGNVHLDVNLGLADYDS